jgi:PII-like signaling protein
MHGLRGERVLLRIYIEEQDKHDGRPLYEAILELLRNRHYAGATVLRGTLGFGPSGHVHTEHTFAIREDVPTVIEVVDTDERIQAILPELDGMLSGGLITLEKVRVIMYRPSGTFEERAEDHEIEITGSWRVPPPEGVRG